jgi:predicted PurR-regulated permease PerM
MMRPEDHRAPAPAQERRGPVNKWALAVALAVAFAFLYVVRIAVLPFLIAAAIAYIAEPGVRALQRRWHVSRAMAAFIVFLGVMAVLAALGAWTLMALEGELVDALSHVPQLLQKFLTELFGAHEFDLLGHHYVASQLAQQMADTLFGGVREPQQWVEAAVAGFALVTAIILVIVLIYYFLADGPGLAAGALWLVPPEYREEVAEVAAKIDPMLRRYITGLLVIVALATIMSWLAIAFVLHLPFAFLLALLTGLLELIPVLGPMLSATIVGLLALTEHGFWAVVAFAVYVTLFRLAIDRLFGPIILGRAVSIHPIVVMFAFLAGGLFLGVPGVILAVPAAASVKIVLDHYYAHPMRHGAT